MAVVTLVVAVWAYRVVSGLSHIFHTNPISVIQNAVGLGGDSAVDAKAKDLQRVNIVLYGYGGPGHSGPYLTDSIMVVSIQPQQSGPPRVAEIGIPRDWEVPIDLGQGHVVQDRINTAYESGMIDSPYRTYVDKSDSRGGGRVADATIEEMLGIHVDFFVGVDFDAFKQAVDSVGGIDVDVPHTFTDHHYPSDTCDTGGRCVDTTIHFDQGRQHMDGQTALRFARSRESDDPVEQGNFARNRRQQLVLNAVKTKVLSVGGIGRLPDLLGALGDHVITDMPFDSAKSIYDLVKDVDPASIVRLSIDDSNFIHECTRCSAAVEEPYDRTFASVQHYVQNVFVSPEVLAARVPITVVDASGRGAGADQRWATLLTGLGFQATPGGTQRRSATTHVVDRSGGSGTAAAQWLAAYYGVTAETPSPAAGAAATDTGGSPAGGITVVLGQDEESSFNNPSQGRYLR